jgi:hypothetical protein
MGYAFGDLYATVPRGGQKLIPRKLIVTYPTSSLQPGVAKKTYKFQGYRTSYSEVNLPPSRHGSKTDAIMQRFNAAVRDVQISV